MDQRVRKLAIVTWFFLLLTAVAASAQEADLTYSGNSSWYLVERSNWSTYVKGSYIGLTHREIHSQLKAGAKTPSGQEYSGYFYKMIETNKDAKNVSLPIDALVEARFTVAKNGTMKFYLDKGYPEYRDFPVFPADPVNVGDSWVAEGVRCVDPLNNGKISDLKIVVQYRLTGESVYDGEDVWQITAKFATRYPVLTKPLRVDAYLSEATGTHDVQIVVRKFDGAVVVIMDRLDETYTYKDGNSIRFRGTTAIFAEQAVSGEKLALALEGASRGAVAQADKITPLPDGKTGIRDSESTTSSQSGGPGTISGKDVSSTSDQGKDEGASSGPGTSAQTGIQPLADAGIGKAGEENGKLWTTEETERGVRISVRNLRFVADSDELLPTERGRLDSVAAILKTVENGHFLVEGHTAATGKPAGEAELSLKRAKKIVDELCARGMKPEQFIYRGLGGTVPIGDNSTDDGRALNRRVEITVLD